MKPSVTRPIYFLCSPDDVASFLSPTTPHLRYSSNRLLDMATVMGGLLEYNFAAPRIRPKPRPDRCCRSSYYESRPL